MTEWQKIKMFRCVQDPMVGPKPRNAFMLPELPDWTAYLHVPSGTIHVTTDKGRQHVIGMGNWSSIELYKESEGGQTQDFTGAGDESTQTQKRTIGRPKLQPSQGV
jgi:hypothetical protein